MEIVLAMAPPARGLRARRYLTGNERIAMAASVTPAACMLNASSQSA
jgi:hypothetical protein